MKVRRQFHAPAALHTGTAPGTQYVGGWVGLRAGLDVVTKRKKPWLCRESKPGRPARNVVTILTDLRRLPFIASSVMNSGNSRIFDSKTVTVQSSLYLSSQCIMKTSLTLYVVHISVYKPEFVLPEIQLCNSNFHRLLML